MATITTSECPNFNGAAHDHSDHPLVPQQLKGAHLHPLRKLGTNLEKAPAPAKWGEFEGKLKASEKRYGVCLTRSKLFVLDIDTHNGIDGNKTLAKVLKKLDLELDTFTVATGTGGFHYYFHLPKEIQASEIKKAVNLWPGVDVFPLGQQIVGPGSTRTLADGSIGRYEVSHDTEIAELPKKLIKAILKRIEKNASSNKKSSTQRIASYTPRVIGDLTEKQDQVLQAMTSEMSTAPAGNRHSTILRVAFNAGAFFGPELEGTVYHEVERAAIASGHDQKCAHNDARSAWEAGTAEWQPYTPLEFEAEIKKPTTEKSKTTQEDNTLKIKLNDDFFNEINVARAYAEARGSELMSVEQWNAWARFDSKRGFWESVKQDVINTDLMKWFADEVYPQVKAKTESKKGKKSSKLRNKASRFLNLPGCKNAASFVYGDVMKKAEVFDANPDVLLAANGAINLQTGEIRKALPSDYFSKNSEVKYKPNAKSELWDEILTAFDPEVLDYLQGIIGQALTGYQPSDASVYFFSAGGENGKSTFLDVITRVMGSYANTPDSSLLTSGGSNSFSRYIFKGLRMALLEETANGSWLDDKMVKKIAGTEKMRGALKHKDEETFKVMATIFITTNFLPQVSANDDGTWRRLKLFPMPYKYPKNYNAETDPAHYRPRNPKLINAKDNDEIAEAALAWAVEGAVKWYKNQKQEPEIPEVMRKAANEWRSRQDKISTWWEEWMVEDENSFVLIPDLYETYKRSVADSGKETESKQKFMAALAEHAIFQKAGAEYVKQQRVPKSLIHSSYVPPARNRFEETEALSAVGARYFVKGLRFRNAND